MKTGVVVHAAAPLTEGDMEVQQEYSLNKIAELKQKAREEGLSIYPCPKTKGRMIVFKRSTIIFKGPKVDVLKFIESYVR